MPNVLPSRLRALRRRASSARNARGQSLVELALTLPIILFLTMVALDFGRVYLGYINLQNMARIAANFAANNPDAWGDPGDSTLRDRYRNQILADAAATNCQLPQSGGAPVVPDPTFTDVTGDGITNGLGDTGTVGLTCTFGVITPAISNVLGGSVKVSAETSFMVKTGLTSIAAGNGEILNGTPPYASFSANDSVISPDGITVTGPTVSVVFRDTSGGYPSSWLWEFPDGTSTLEDPLGHTFSCAVAACSYVVKMTATNLLGSSTASMTVTVLGNSTVNFTSDTQSGQTPLTVNFTDASTAGGTAYAWSFGDGGTGSGTTASHVYTKAGWYDVSHTVTYPSPVGNVTTTKQKYISIGVGNCTVPSLTNMHFNDAQAVWQGAPYYFTGIVLRSTSAPSGNFTITAQSLTATSLAPCDSNVFVDRP